MNISEILDLCRKYSVRIMFEARPEINGYIIRVMDCEGRSIERATSAMDLGCSALSSEAIFTDMIYLMLKQLGIEIF